MRHINILLGFDFVRFCIVGGIGFVINLALLSLLYGRLGLPIVVSQLIAAEIALFSNFILHHNWTYKKRAVTKSKKDLVVQFHATSWVAIIGSSLLVSAFTHYLHLQYILALAASSILVLFWNFSWSKYVIWQQNKVEEEQS
jgi:putative flippase GtrA